MCAVSKHGLNVLVLFKMAVLDFMEDVLPKHDAKFSLVETGSFVSLTVSFDSLTFEFHTLICSC